MRKIFIACCFLCLTACAPTGIIRFISTGNPVSDVLVNSMIEESIASTGRSFMRQLYEEQKGNLLAFIDRRTGRCRNPRYDYYARLRFCGDWD